MGFNSHFNRKFRQSWTFYQSSYFSSDPKKNILSRLQDENKQNPDLKSILEDSEEFFRRNFLFRKR
ncbi:hypothetical protein LEP1GSC043_4621 [Leptospira weilii str. Ecochallenge]|uniref:Uncharacterized protein n=1 Tax=Leptospira weilii str. Ecochallenge TaxID=1049986 RepID=N1U681_9LEPT|nr:hypothetical protein LEP1GSC043_4621 [Leptospira weilii str. Ecochallenge]